MKAITFSEYGPAEVLRLVEVPKPVPTGNEVLVKVRAASVNAADWRMMSASPFLVRFYSGLFRPKRVTSLGGDVAGVVEVVGPDVTRFKPGDEVFGEVFASGFGSFAEYKCAFESELELKPANVSFEEAAAFPLAGMTALQGLRDVGRIQAGQRVLINGASGGVGTFAVQLARHFGAEVTAVCSAKKMEQARALGADHIIDYAQQDFTRNGERYDLILRRTVPTILDYCAHQAPQGRCMIGGAATVVPGVAVHPAHWRRGWRLDAKANLQDLRLLKQLVEAGKLKSVIDKRYPLEQTADAVRYVEQGHAGGKVVVVI
jgi:NADPH:quinone reductase-like Zn-dependent oxidoreductase